MKSFKAIVREIKDTGELRHVIEVYEEVAATKMQKIRTETLVSRDFFDGLMKTSEGVGLDFESLKMEKPLKEAVILISANSGLYGDIISKTFTLFAGYIKNKNPDIYVVGKVGKEMMERTFPGRAFGVVEMSDEEIEESKFAELSEKLISHERITVFYGRFGSIINQYSHLSTISGETIREFEKGKPKKIDLKKIRLKYFYEPGVLAVSEFFGNEILKTTFEAMLRESQLAKFGSRLMHLDMAISRIDGKLINQSFEMRKIKKRMQEKKQRQVLASVLFR